MWAVRKFHPIRTGLDKDVFNVRSFLDQVGQLVIQRPVPPHDAIDQHGQVDGMAGQVAAFKRGGSACFEELLLLDQGAHALGDDEIHLVEVGGALDDMHQVRMHAGQA